MRRRRILAGLLLALAAPLAAEAQQPGKVYRIGVLSSGSPATSGAFLDAFRQRLRELGYAEDRNVTIESRYAAAQLGRFRDLAAELVGLGVDVIVASGTQGTRAAREATSTMPIVMVSVGDAVGAGLVKSLPKPGGNITGQSFMGSELAVKGFDVLTEAFPRASRLAVLFNPEISPESTTFRALDAAARARGVRLQPVVLRRPEDLSPAFAAMNKARPNALLVFAVSASEQNRIVEFTAKNQLPALFGFREAVDAGGLMSFGPKLLDLWRGAANYVGKILKGAKPADLPVEQPSTFELVINLKTAKALGLTIPPSLLLRADQVIE
jgi:putative ABC transport system substrate-binding protein